MEWDIIFKLYSDEDKKWIWYFGFEYVDQVTIRSDIKAKHGTTAVLEGNFWVLPAAKIRVIKVIRADLAVIIETQTRSFRGKLITSQGHILEDNSNKNFC